ncbi:DUF4362 domain-containing protein [Paractinoplanes rishiriensis]|uniref:Lipoprotein n=1 Tax=Paractinoplanes rishiriensis TaxID=1050105 RepID=A0A919N0L6_9ACTN|nr:DUF4362 domain-containing protein [Actinoplanes rishiriensis]GIE95257.1 hypothetical protein Ari01nite_27220 [Actinoplanes rishiriensis]
MRRILLLAAATGLLAACGGPDAATPLVYVSTPAADCGTFKLGQGEHLPVTAGECFVDAVRGGKLARLAVTRPTTEGDPIPYTYTSRLDGSVEVITDRRQDAFGTRTVTRDVCTGVTFGEHLEFASCTPQKE